MFFTVLLDIYFMLQPDESLINRHPKFHTMDRRPNSAGLFFA
jgi:hypothetical protein